MAVLEQMLSALDHLAYMKMCYRDVKPENILYLKMDVWSLFATIADVHRKFSFSPTQAKSYADVLHAMRAAALAQPNLADMVQENPHHRALAAQLLAAHFGGRAINCRGRPVFGAGFTGADNRADQSAGGIPLVEYHANPRGTCGRTRDKHRRRYYSRAGQDNENESACDSWPAPSSACTSPGCHKGEL
ncbi:hypothetical protein N657DRAFT_681557 [Parathielavia appendiculata]|uniref:Protein kinase domain-containing protein n=1 Tax=Parathielavia appendiculata TaxID=2587402 RepID=A0AAN6TXE9_9PEZI|nr:hypothetical protein N657DRAFT_681557 [Parathielavia appendiculata]